MGDYRFKTIEHEARRWCIRNNILIAPLAKSGAKWNIEIKINSKATMDPNIYGKTEIWEKICEYYMYYYNKRKK